MNERKIVGRIKKMNDDCNAHRESDYKFQLSVCKHSNRKDVCVQYGTRIRMEWNKKNIHKPKSNIMKSDEIRCCFDRK